MAGALCVAEGAGLGQLGARQAAQHLEGGVGGEGRHVKSGVREVRAGRGVGLLWLGGGPWAMPAPAEDTDDLCLAGPGLMSCQECMLPSPLQEG